MIEKNRNPFAPEALTAQPICPELRHPFFDNTRHPNSLDCLDAIKRASGMIELLNCLDPDGRTQGELTPEAVSGYRHLMEMLRETIAYSSSRLAILNRKRQRKRRRKARKRARQMAALANSLSALDTR